MITHKQVKRLLHYNPGTGVFTWLVRDPDSGNFNSRWAGKVAGSVHMGDVGKRYIRIKIFGKVIEAHRLIWLYMKGEWPIEIDHENGDGTDNRWCNIRNVSQGENKKNKRRYSNNRTGVNGVHWDAESNKYRVRIGRQSLGRYTNFNEAVAARKAVEIEQKYHPNHGSVRAL